MLQVHAADWRDFMEKKERLTVWLYPSTIQKISELFPQNNCKSPSEYIENAIKFYSGYIETHDASEFLSRTLVSSIRGTLDDSENRTARLLFKLAVELSMTMHVVASDRGIGERDLAKLRAKCVQDVRKSIGTVSFDEAVKYQNGF
jgi:hypothetical protein